MNNFTLRKKKKVIFTLAINITLILMLKERMGEYYFHKLTYENALL